MLRVVIAVFLLALLSSAAIARDSDGCSAGISKAWRFWLKKPPPFEHCCVEHDKAYWRGGTSSQRAKADRALYSCVKDYNAAWAAIILIGVKGGGQPFFPFDWETTEIDRSHDWWYGR